MSHSGTLFLVTTPVSELGPLDQKKKDQLEEAYQRGDLICVEDHKPARRRWISWGLSRQAVDDFILYNEHTREKLTEELLASLMKGKNIYLMSDGGVPAFCDPGQVLVDLCHQKEIAVKGLDSDNSVCLSLALSGFGDQQFFFAGMVPKKDNRSQWLDKMIKMSKDFPVVMMDTGYRLERFVSDLNQLGHPSLRVALVLEIGNASHTVLRAKPSVLLKKIQGLKANFVAVTKA